MSQRKIDIALRNSAIGPHRATAMHLLEVAAIPTDTIASLIGKPLGTILDTSWRLAQISRALANSEVLQEGSVWGTKHQAFVELRA